jgi:hypothetical protein
MKQSPEPGGLVKEKHMVTFLLSVVVLSALIFAGYRFSMYLYAQGALGAGSHRMESIGVESFPVQPMHDVVMEVRDYGLRYARVGLLIIAGSVVVLVIGMIAALFALF